MLFSELSGIQTPFLLALSQKIFGLSALLQLLYPDNSLGSVTAVTHSSHVSQKTAALYGTICHGFLHAITMYFILRAT
jgi:hypothetical protein